MHVISSIAKVTNVAVTVIRRIKIFLCHRFLDEPYLLAPKHIDLPFDSLVQQIILFMVRNPVITVFVIVKLFHGFQNNPDVWFASSVDELGTVFVCVNK
jgi:hypothetical protein